jgi:hypothetical protein
MHSLSATTTEFVLSGQMGEVLRSEAFRSGTSPSTRASRRDGAPIGPNFVSVIPSAATDLLFFSWVVRKGGAAACFCVHQQPQFLVYSAEAESQGDDLDG